MDNKTCPVPQKLLFLITIVNREDGELAVDFYRAQGIDYVMVAPCYGAAGLELLDFLGMTETEKEMVICVGNEDLVQRVLPLAEKKLQLDEAGKGVAFTIPVAGISGPKALYYVMGHGEKKRMEDHQNE